MQCSRCRAIAASVTADADGFPPHIALPDAPPGVVEIWEPMKPDERKRDRRLGRAVRHRERDEPAGEARAAHRAHGARLVESGAPVGIERRAARYGDVLVLVRQRGPLFEAIIRALKKRTVEVAGADRLVLTEHIAVMDLMALADALLLPAGRSGACGRAAQPAVRLRPTRTCSRSPGIADRARCMRRSSARPPSGRFLRKPPRGSMRLREAARRESPFAFYAPRARRRRRPEAIPRAARRRSKRRARRIPQSRARLRAARNAVAARLHRLAARGARGGQTRHGDRARRSAGDDRARRQGPRSADRHSRRHDDAAGRAAAAAALLELPGGAGRWSGRDARTTTCGRSRPRARRRSRKRRTNIAGSFMSR